MAAVDRPLLNGNHMVTIVVTSLTIQVTLMSLGLRVKISELN